MDNIPFRTSGSGNRSSQQSETEGESTVEQSAERPHRSASAHHAAPKKSDKKKKILAAIVIIVIVILGGLGLWMLKTSDNTASAIDGSKYQAIFFTNGQVYFGKLHTFNSEYLKLTDIFYLQTKTAAVDPKNPQKTTDDSNNVQLIKLGDEIHGPQDEMIIAKDQVLFYENLKDNGKVATSIQKYKNPN